MKRLFESYLNGWKVKPNRKPMVIRGARQVGKTWLVDRFGEGSFKYYLKVNPEKNPNLKAVFKHNDPRLIINELTALFNIPVVAGETLLFIDEVQLLP
ncbi:MAG: AAA family ATPase, partial [Bacteroidales bacterium]